MLTSVVHQTNFVVADKNYCKASAFTSFKINVELDALVYLPAVKITDTAASVADVKIIVQDDKPIFIPKVVECVLRAFILTTRFKIEYFKNQSVEKSIVYFLSNFERRIQLHFA